MSKFPPTKIHSDHPDFVLCTQLVEYILCRVGGRAEFEQQFPKIIRRAIDEVIDTPRTGRLILQETEKTEKTYLGTKIEILVRDFLGFPKGKLDLDIDGQNVDIKNTVGKNWMIPSEAFNQPCILIASDESTFKCSFGIIIAKEEYLTAGENKDKKRSISAHGKGNILWIINDFPYPENFWSSIDKDTALYITDSKASATERIARLFTKIQRRVISRSVIEGIARQNDYMKRLRKNGGARDKLNNQSIAVLSGIYDADLISRLKLPCCGRNEFVSIKPATEIESILLEKAEKL